MSTSSSTSSGGGDGSASIDLPKTNPPATGLDDCLYEVSPTDPSCRIERTCRSCLQTPGCFVGSWGGCYYANASTSLVAPELWEATANSSNVADKTLGMREPQYWEFRATDYTYCPADDQVCKQCNSTSFWRPGERNWQPDNRFCVGADGCVCILSCEANADFPPACVDLSLTPQPTETESKSGMTTEMKILITVIVFLFIAMLGYLRVRSGKSKRSASTNQGAEALQEHDEEAQQRPQGSGLTLSGWAKNRGDVTSKETSQSAPYVVVREQ